MARTPATVVALKDVEANLKESLISVLVADGKTLPDTKRTLPLFFISFNMKKGSVPRFLCGDTPIKGCHAVRRSSSKSSNDERGANCCIGLAVDR